MDPVANRDLMWIAEEALWAPLPDEWTEHFDSANRVFYHNIQEHTSTWTHPLEQFHRDIYNEIVDFRSRPCADEEQTVKLAACRLRCEQAEKESRRVLPVWTEHFDEAGRRFFFNRVEGRSVWTDPRRARDHKLHMQLQVYRALCEHAGVHDPLLGSPRQLSIVTAGDLLPLDLGALEEVVPAERTDHLVPYNSRRPKAMLTMSNRTPISDAHHIAVADCVVCFDAAATHIVVPCGHQALCRTCATRCIQSTRRPICPCCRARVERIIEVFVPKTRLVDEPPPMPPSQQEC